MKNNNPEKYEQIGSKISPDQMKVLNACCDAMGVDIYHLMQWFCYAIIKMAAPVHEIGPRTKKLMTILDTDADWQRAFNLANPDELKVSQVILILEQKRHKGFGAIEIDHNVLPGQEPQMTECVDDILERVAEVTMPGIYRRLRRMGAALDCTSLSDILLTMLDAQELINTTESDTAEGPQMGDRADNGRLRVEYGKLTKRGQKRSPDSVAQDQRFHFDDIDHNAPAPADLKEWEGEHHDSR